MTADTLDRQGNRQDGSSVEDTIIKLAQDGARRGTASLASLTDSSTGAAGAAVNGSVAFVGAAVSGTNLADQTTARAALKTVQDGVAEIIAKANACLSAVNLPTYTDNSGATAADGTIGAVSAVTGAATGVAVVASNAVRAELDAYVYTAAQIVNKVATAVGVAGLTNNVRGSNFLVAAGAAIAAIDTTATGVAGTPAVTQVEITAALTAWKNDIASMAAVLNAATADTVKPQVVVAS